MTRAGTGKTYASAFALRDQNPDKILFIVHREQIAKQALKSYKRVFGVNKKYGLLSGDSKDYHADIVFSTMNMMAKDETLAEYKPEEFEIIVIDEVHRAGASSYQKIMSYFKPKMWLGMTASPDRTEFLSGDDSQSKREELIDRLTSDDRNDSLDYIFTVDIFNEGVDIPEVNQVIMLRPTESLIVFIQQLGRGLRKAEDKEYVVILDFIGNYANNYMIPIALSGDRSYNKDNMRRYVADGTRIIPGSSSIHFDEISRKRIFESIDAAKTLPVFINYDKSEDAIAYEDRFVAPDELIALSKHPRKITSSDADHFYKRTAQDKDNKIYLFVRKNKDDHEAKEFYFLGEITAHDEPTPIKMPVIDKDGNTKMDDAFEIKYHLDCPVRDDLYDYITD